MLVKAAVSGPATINPDDLAALTAFAGSFFTIANTLQMPSVITALLAASRN